MQDAAGQFVTYYNSVQAKNLIAFSEDAYVPSPPRYVLPATVDFYEEEQVEEDPYYPIFNNIIDSGEPFPNSGIVENITQRYEKICGMVQENIPDTSCDCVTEPDNTG